MTRKPNHDAVYVRAAGVLDQAGRSVANDDFAAVLRQCRMTISALSRSDQAHLVAVLATALVYRTTDDERRGLCEAWANNPLLGDVQVSGARVEF